MRFFLVFFGVFGICAGLDTIYDYTVKNADGNVVSMEKYRGKVVIFVNAASYCGYTRANYEDLKVLEEKYYEKGLRVAVFPCNQFGQQEPDPVPNIISFIDSHFSYRPEFYDKIHVNGPEASELFKFLKNGDDITWNFWKFVVNRQGIVAARFDHTVNPRSFESTVVGLLEEEDDEKVEL